MLNISGSFYIKYKNISLKVFLYGGSITSVYHNGEKIEPSEDLARYISKHLNEIYLGVGE